MASSFKELNNQFIKRPAVALFRKPFANNDEMSNILEGMLNIYASVEQESVTKYKAPIYKAIYWNHLGGKPIKERYGEVVTFFPEGTKQTTNWNAIEKAAKVDTKSAVYTMLKSVFPSPKSILRTLKSFLVDGKDAAFKEIAPNATVALTELTAKKAVITSFELAEKDQRTYDLWILDPRLTVLGKNVTTSTSGLNVSKINTPYVTGIFEEIYENKSKYVNTPDGKKLLKELKGMGINPENIKFYTVVVGKGVHHITLSEKAVINETNSFYSKGINQRFVAWRDTCTKAYNYLKDKYKNVLGTKLVDYAPFANKYNKVSTGRSELVASVQPKSFNFYDFKISVQDTFLDVSSVVGDTYTFKEGQKVVEKDTFFGKSLLRGSVITSSFPSRASVYAKDINGKLNNYKYYYERDSKSGYIILKSNFDKLTINDLLNIYKELAYLSGANNLSSSSYNNFIEVSEDVVQRFGYDTPLRLEADYVGTYLDSSFNWWNSSFQDPEKLLKAFLQVARLRARSTKVIDSTTIKQKLNYGYIPTVLDFKLEYYAEIFKRYIKPRYEKYEDFIKSGLMKVYPFDIMDKGKVLVNIAEALQLQPKQSLVPDTYNFLSSIESMSKEDKLSLVNYFEGVLYDNISGFYTTSVTPISETIAPYANTVITENNITRLANNQASNILSALNILGSSDGYFSGLNNVSNKDVSTISISRQAKGKSSASVLLKNLNNKYNFTSGLYAGEIIFEPMDDVFIYLPTLEEKLTLSFKGFVDSAEYINDKGYNSIGLKLSCPLKKLELSRTNIKPSLSSAENNNSSIHPFVVPPQMFDSIERWAPFMLMQALTFYSSMLKASTIEDAEKRIYEVDAKTQLPEFNDILLKFLWYRQTNSYNTQDIAAQAISELTDLYTTSTRFENGDLLSNAVEIDGVVNLYQSYSESSANSKINYNIIAQRLDGIVERENRHLVGQLLGTLQPAWVIGSSDINIVFSDYRTNLDILMETSEKFNCYLYSDRNGVVQFRPPQISLMNLNCETYDNQNTISHDIILKENDFNFSLRPDVLSQQTCSSYHTQCNDSELVTWLQLSGQNIWGCIDAEAGNAIVIQDLPKSLKYGIKSQQQQILSGVGKKEALYIYGLCLLDRQNSLFRSGNASGIASGDMDLNVTVYSPVDNTVFLIDGLSITYDAGKTMTYNIPLKWGRKPLFKIPLLSTPIKRLQDQGSSVDTFLQNAINDITNSRFLENSPQVSLGDKVDYIKLKSLLSDAVEKYIITDAYYNQLISYIDYVEKYPQYDYLLASFMFNGYVWDGISSISFEDIILSYFGGLLSQDTGIELALGLNNKSYTKEKVDNLSKELFTSLNKTINLHATLLRTVIPNGDSVQKQIDIYIGNK